jgi:hypothetical protein
MTHPKRPRDPNQLAKSIIDIATGQKPDRDPTPEEQGKDPAAVALGKKGGAARSMARWEVDTIFEFEKEPDALQWIKEKSQGLVSGNQKGRQLRRP